MATTIKPELLESLKKSVETLNKNIIKHSDAVVKNTKSKADAVDSESKRENDKRQDKMLEYLSAIVDNTKITKRPEAKEFDFGIGGIAKAIGLALGAFLGIMLGQLKAIRAFAELLTPNLVKSLKSAAQGLGEFFSKARTWVSGKGTSFLKSFEEFFSKAGKFFKIEDSSLIGKVLTRLKSILDPFKSLFKMVSNAGKMIATPIETVMNFFKAIGGYFSQFGKYVGLIVKGVSKLFAPLAIIMAVIDSVKGAIEGFKEGGIIGGIVGAFEGLVDSLIMVPLDLLKDLVSWILGKLGFENASEALDSFSFSDIFHKIIDTIKNFVGSAVDWVTENLNPMNWFKSDKDAEVKPKPEAKKEIAIPKPAEVKVAGPVESPPVEDTRSLRIKQDEDDPYGDRKDEVAAIKNDPNLSKGQRVRALSKIRKEVYAERQKGEDAEMVHVGRDSVTGENIYRNDRTLETMTSPLSPEDVKNKNLTADKIGAASSEAEMAKSSSGSKGNSAIVNAPSTTINSATNNNLVKPPVRNVDPSLNSYYKQKYI